MALPLTQNAQLRGALRGAIASCTLAAKCVQYCDIPSLVYTGF